MTLTVSIGGLGEVGLKLARVLDAGVDGLRLVAVSARDRDQASPALQSLRRPPRLVDVPALAEADIVVEAATRAEFDAIATAAIMAGRVFVPVSASALLPRLHLLKLARENEARILVPGGAVPGLDVLRALAEAPIESVTLDIRAPPAALAGSRHPGGQPSPARPATKSTRVFRGNAVEAVAGFPAWANAATALALAGIGPVRTKVEIWADPRASRATYAVRVEAAAARVTMSIEVEPGEAHPLAGPITWMSVLACLRGLTATLRVGS